MLSYRAHGHLNISDALDRWKTFPPLRGSGFFNKNGVELLNFEFAALLTIEKAKGRTLLPMSTGCGHTCSNSKNCAGFDYEKNGCPGYKV